MFANRTISTTHYSETRSRIMWSVLRNKFHLKRQSLRNSKTGRKRLHLVWLPADLIRVIEKKFRWAVILVAKYGGGRPSVGEEPSKRAIQVSLTLGSDWSADEPPQKRGEREQHTAAWLTQTRNQTHLIPYGNRRDYLLNAVIKFGNPLEPSRLADD